MTQPKFFEALGSQIEHVAASAGQVRSESIQHLETLPLRVLSSSDAGSSRLQADAALSRRSHLGQHIQVENSGHWIPLDAPDAVIEAIKDVVQSSRLSRS